MSEIIHGLSNDEYHDPNGKWGEYVSSTALKRYLISPRAYKYALTHPEAETDAMKFGSLFHDLMAYLAESMGDWQRGYAEWLGRLARFDAPINPKTNQPYGATTKAYAEAYQQFLADNEGKTVVNALDSDLAADMAYSLLNDCGTTSEQVRKLLKWTKATEVSYFYEDDNEIKIKIRPDHLTNGYKLVDWKSCSLKSLDEDSIAKQIIQYRYDVSLSQYQYVLNKMEGKWYTPFLVFVSKIPPYESVICDMSEWCYSYNKEFDIVTPGVGALEFSRLLQLHTECVKANEWPGIEHTLSESDNKIMNPAVPYWFGRKYFEEE